LRATGLDALKQIARGLFDGFHATWIGESPKVRLDEDLPVTGLSEALVEASLQSARICDAFLDARVILAVGTHDQSVRWKADAGREGFDFLPVAALKMSAAASALGHAHHRNAQGVIQPDQQFHIPRKHCAEGVRAKAAFTGQAQRQPRQLHAFAGFAPRSIELATGSGHISGEGAELVSIKPGDMLDDTAQTQLQNRRDDLFLAVLGQKGDLAACIKRPTGHQIGSARTGLAIEPVPGRTTRVTAQNGSRGHASGPARANRTRS